MGRKVFISFLGSSNYKPCEYFKDGTSYGRNKFIQIATIRYLKEKFSFSQEDQYLFLLTEDARQKNWIDNGQKDRSGTPIPYSGLKGELDNLSVPYSTLENLPIGNNEEEILEIFEKIYQYTEEGDELYFDITHGFRYLPMLVVVFGHFSKFLKKTTVESITYGNFEISEGGTKPGLIVDLTYLNLLLDWTSAASEFVKSGDIETLRELNIAQVKKGFVTGGKTGRLFEEATASKKITDNVLPKFLESIRGNRGKDIINSTDYSEIEKRFKSLRLQGDSPLSLLLREIFRSLSGFSPRRNVKNGFAAASWCYKKGLYQQCVTQLQESVISCFCDKFRIHIDDFDARTAINGALSFNRSGTSAFKHTEGYRELQDTILHTEAWDSICQQCSKLSSVRNDYNHAGFRKGAAPASSLLKAIKESLDFFYGEDGEAYDGFISKIDSYTFKEPLSSEHSGKPLFINVSNHPSDLWSDKQISAARKLGKVLEIAFPDVDPEYSTKEVMELANDLYNVITARMEEEGGTPSSTHIHIMGEMTLTYALVQKLKEAGFDCLAATSKRKVYYNEKNEKVVDFNFKQFRQY